MSNVMYGVDRRTQLVGRNRLELLLFRLSGKQIYGINVFKVREVVKCPPLTKLPQSNPVVRGIAHMRGNTVTIMDLGLAISSAPVADDEEAFVVLTEFNRSIQGFLVGGVERIVNMNWDEILPPPIGTGKQNYMTAVTNVDGKLVEIIDVEKVLAEVVGAPEGVSDSVAQEIAERAYLGKRVLIADDSSVARKQIARTMDQIGVEYDLAKNGQEALDMLQKWADEDDAPITQRVSVVISDIEMPEMDGYTLTKKIKEDPRLQDLYILLHTSLSGVFNDAMVKKVGANEFVPKFKPDELAMVVARYVHQGEGME